MDDTREKRRNGNRGITLAALVVTIVVLLILAGITITYVIGDNSVFKQAQNAKLQTEIAKAREKLEITFGHAKLLKHTDNKYNQNDYLDDLMEKEIPNIEIIDNIVTVDGYVFEIDRSEPKIGEYRGEKKTLAFPEVTATATIADDNKQATINITAKEEKNGISRIEIWLLGEKIKEYTYDKVKTEITVDPPYIATQNGEYKIKAYAGLGTSTTVKVAGIVASVKFEPNKNDTWQQTHIVKATIQETGEEIVKAKYLWTDSVNAPEDDEFPDAQTFKSGDTITGGNKDMTGIYYLWTMLETRSGSKAKWRSEGFKFDNQGPTVTLNTKPISKTSFSLTASAQDLYSDILRYEFHVAGEEIYNLPLTEDTATYTWNGAEMSESKECYVTVYDSLGNSSSSLPVNARTCLFTWTEYDFTASYSLIKEEGVVNTWRTQVLDVKSHWTTPVESDYFSKETGMKSLGGSTVRIDASNHSSYKR